MSDRSAASSRLRVYKVADELTKLGHRVSFNEVSNDTHVVVVQKRYNLDAEIAKWRSQGIRVIFDLDDMIPLPIADVDCITVDTRYKQQKLPGSVVIPDCLDAEQSSPFKSHHEDMLRTAVWTGSPDNVYHVRACAEACRWVGVELTIITNLLNPQAKQICDNLVQLGGVTLKQWDLATVDKLMVQHDIAVMPYVFDGAWSKEWVESKSANKLLKSWSLGLPTIGTPILSYVEVGLDYMATSIEEWCNALTAMESSQVRFKDAQRGSKIAGEYRADKVVNKWLEVMVDANI